VMPVSINELANAALDRAYKQTAGQLLLQVQAVTNNPRSQMQRALKELEDEAARLADAEQKLQIDNAVLQKTLNEYETSLKTTQALISANDNLIQESGQSLAVAGVTAKVFNTLAQTLYKNKIDPLSPAGTKAIIEQATKAGIKWNTALDFAVDYVDSEAWLAKMEGWGTGYANLTRGVVLDGIGKGWGPGTTAAQMRRYAQNIPGYAAENLTRTLQLTSYRDASVAMEQVNSDFIIGKIRIAALDDRTCISCIALHGTELKPGERVDDHYRGRCSEFYVVPGGPKMPGVMQADSRPGQRNFVEYQNGNDWFNSLPASRQQRQASFMKSPAKWLAFQDGHTLNEFVGDHVDDVFGNQKIERSLLDMLGGDAAGYYTVNQ